ncbi:DNA-directed RNA polymerases i, ii, and iii 145 kDa polypeptide [Delphinella strobiligena]|nr:DNA-directed RNA polymerases i, ii, and iii 145 kDa polypeptide [Delphinella strobiligena]
MADATLFDDTFTITSLNAQKYDRVSRITGTSADSLTVLSLDVNTEIYPVNVGEPIQLVLASTLNLDGSKEDPGSGSWREIGNGKKPTLADMFDYVCHGKVYRFEEGEGENIKVYISFGGLLLYIEGPYKKLTSLRIDYCYLLIKK